MTLEFHKDLYVIVRLPSNSEEPIWLDKNHFYSCTRTQDEFSIVCLQDCVPEGIEKIEKDWSLIQVQGVLDFSLTGILSSVANPLAEKKISIFALSTFDTDYIMVKQNQVLQAREALSKAGFLCI